VTDAQSGHEKTLTGLLPALAGANLIYGLGMLESGVTLDFGQLVVDAEFARMIKFAVGGIPVSDETLAVEDIAAVGSFGDFLSLDATYRHMREQSSPKLIDRRVREDWQAMGATSLYDRAVVEARRILETHNAEPLPDDVQVEMTEIVAQTERDLGVGQIPG
jgi:trimethylamine--corrinoid protein Co-methyltransferase